MIRIGSGRAVCPFFILMLWLTAGVAMAAQEPYAIVDTGQQRCYDTTGTMSCPQPGAWFNGQDAQYAGHVASYRDNGDGTISDLVTGLMWVKERGEKLSWNDAMRGAAQSRAGGYTDWRMPTIKELYSLIDFRGRVRRSAASSTPYLDTRYFGFAYGDDAAGERIIDCQDWSSTQYTGTTMGGAATIFGVNFADGRIKGYPKGRGGNNPHDMKFVRYVRGNSAYGKNTFVAGGDGTVKDRATGLVWQQQDSGSPMNWESALNYCENLVVAGHNDWRLPNAKELQSIVDYTRSPQATHSAAIDPVFGITQMESYFWTGTTHLDGRSVGANAVYVAFGRAMGYFAPPRSSAAKQWIDVHGAGAQRSDPKTGNPKDYAQGFGPQGDDRRIFNYVRCVRGGTVVASTGSRTDTPPWSTAQQEDDRPSRSDMPLNGSKRGAGSRMGNDPMQGAGRPGGQQGMPQGMPQGMQRPPDGMQSGMRQGGSGGQHRPPQEALMACKGISEGETCSFATPRGTMEGICRQLQEDVACVPANAPGGAGAPFGQGSQDGQGGPPMQ